MLTILLTILLLNLVFTYRTRQKQGVSQTAASSYQAIDTAKVLASPCLL